MLDSLNKQTFTIVLFHNICYELSNLDYLELDLHILGALEKYLHWTQILFYFC